MRIAMIGSRGLPATHGGVERSVEELGTRLAGLGHQVTVFCRPGYSRTRIPIHRGMCLRYLPAIPTKHLEAASHTFLGAIAAAFGPFDIVHFHCIGPALFAWIPRLTGKKVVVTVQALDWKRKKWGPVAGWFLRLGAWTGVRFSHGCIAVSRSVQRYFETKYGKPVVLLPNGVSPSTFSPGNRVNRWSSKSGSYLLFLGRLVPEKRVNDLIVSFRKVATDARLVIAGDGCYSEGHVGELKRLAAGDRRILFTGGVYGEEKDALLDGARAFVNPSELEGNPIAVLEALSHGLPVLISDIPEHQEILEQPGGAGRLGISFPTGDRNALAGGIERICRFPDDPGAREDRREFVLRRFDWDRITRGTEELYESCRGGSTTPETHFPVPGIPS